MCNAFLFGTSVRRQRHTGRIEGSIHIGKALLQGKREKILLYFLEMKSERAHTATRQIIAVGVSWSTLEPNYIPKFP